MTLRLLFLAITISFIACKNNSSTKEADSLDSSYSSSENVSKSEDLVLEDSIFSDEKIEQLVTKHTLTKEDLYRDYDNGNELADFFFIETISKDTFLAQLKASHNQMIYDSASVSKINGTITLPLKHHKKLTLKDKLADNDSHQEYKYIGQMADLDMYLVLGTYLEDWAYILYDKQNGNKVQSFTGQPYLSEDQLHIISLDADNFEGVVNLSMYGITTNKKINKKYIDPILEIYVKSWIPYTDKYPMFWGKDGCFYTCVIYKDNFLDAQNNYEGLDQYIRIRPLVS